MKVRRDLGDRAAATIRHMGAPAASNGLDASNGTTVELGSDSFPHMSRADIAGSLAIGQTLRGRYVLCQRLGADGKGAVFKALDRYRESLPDPHRHVALKILHTGNDCDEQILANLREFHCAQTLSHQNIVKVYELDRDKDVVFFTMELLDGELLSSVIERMRPSAMRTSQAWKLIRQLGAGLEYAHERGVVHGDLKPANIWVTRDGELRILNLGPAHHFERGVPRPGRPEFAPSSGTPAYASCEQLEGRSSERRDDPYALACICYELLPCLHPLGSRPP